MKDIYYYPMILLNSGKTYKVSFPDFDKVEAEDKNMNKAIFKGKEKLAHYIYELGEAAALPEATDLKDISVKEDEVIMLADVNVLLHTYTYKPKSITRAVTLPEKLNDLAKASGINVSAVLQDALVKILDGNKEEEEPK